MDKSEIQAYVAEKVAGGLTLSRIQDELKAMGQKMTFMELRLIASEIESGVFREQEKKAEPAKKETPEPAGADVPPEGPETEEYAEENGMPFPEEEEELGAGEDPAGPGPADMPEEPPANAGPRGKTSVTLSRIQRPGCMAAGTVSFGSGASGEWILDQMGRLGFEKLSGKPDEQDIREFQMELRKAFGA